MRVLDALSSYPDEALDRLATDKVDEVANLRLPRPILLQEIASALSSLSYVARVLAPARPPTYAILKVLLDAREHRFPAAGMKQAALDITDSLTQHVSDGKGLPSGKNYDLYLKILKAAWENDNLIDRSEALLLEALGHELGFWPREHLLLEHHEVVRPSWESERAFDAARNHLLSTGLVLSVDDCYVLPDEVSVTIRRAWEMDLDDQAYQRLLSCFTSKQLRDGLESMGLPTSGTKEERIERIIQGLVPPALILDTLHVTDIRGLSRECGLMVSAAKAEQITSLIEHFDLGRDLAEPEPEETAPAPPPPPEPRALSSEGLEALLQQLTVDQLQDVLGGCGLRRYGTKAERIGRLVESPWSEQTMLGHLSRAELASLCRKLGHRVSGVKDELIDRLIGSSTSSASASDGAINIALGIDDKAATISDTEATFPEGQGSRTGWDAALLETIPGVRDIQVDYPDLDTDAQFVLALLKKARSLTERDIERACQRHGIGWFLTKAHMADLIAQLDAFGRAPIRIRSAGSFNIYEWVGCPNPPHGHIDKEAARDVIDAVRQGVVPERHLELLAVGQEAARAHLEELLNHVATGRSEFKFVRGQYGAGKTFVCAWLRERALKAGFAVSTVRIGPDQPLSDLPIFFSGLMNGLRTPEKRDTSALADILESWLLALHRTTAHLEGLRPFHPEDREKLSPLVARRIEEELARLASVDAGFAPALRSFYFARLKGDHDLAAVAQAWMRGSRTLSADTLRTIGVRGQLEADQVFLRMRALLEVIRGGRLRGLLLLVDELELVRRFPHARQRERAYETLRGLIDESGENGMPGCLLVFTGTDALFEDSRYGLPSYEALANRISALRTVDGFVSVRQPVIQLEGLTPVRLSSVALRIRDIHALAYGWQAAERVPDAVVERMVTDWTAFSGAEVGRPPRPFLREVVHLLDLCEENPGITAEACLRTSEPSEELAGSMIGILEG